MTAKILRAGHRRRPVPKPAPATQVQAPAAAAPSPRGKLGRLIELLRRPGGATITDLMEATGWQAHSVRGAIAGAVKRKLGLAVVSSASEAGRVYRIEAADDADRG